VRGPHLADVYAQRRVPRWRDRRNPAAFRSSAVVVTRTYSRKLGLEPPGSRRGANPFATVDTATLKAYAYCSPNVSPALAHASSEVGKAHGSAAVGLAAPSRASSRVLGLANVTTPRDDALVPRRYRNCKALNRRYPHGVGRVAARAKTSGDPVTNFRRSNVLYRLNRHLDRDNDFVACEKH
jgi:Excalibur calcium-binding domain